MKFTSLSAIALATTLGLAGMAQAQPGAREHNRPDHHPSASAPHQQHQAAPRAPSAHAPRFGMDRSPAVNHTPRPQPTASHGTGPRPQLHRGQVLPSQWRQRQHVVHDWRARHLSAPPAGQQWVQVGADYALVAIATGLISSLIFGQ